jgi:glycosyltransferase involved in cell wall biosynthesis
LKTALAGKLIGRMPRATIILPTYNWSTVLPFSIGSALRQTFTDFELLVIGDGCTDDSAEVVSRIHDARLRWINLPQNTGHQSGPNNHGLQQAKGELIAYLGHDDLWLPHHLEQAVKMIDAGHDLTYSICETVAQKGDWPTFEPSELEHIQPVQWIPPTCVVHRREWSERVGGWKKFVDVNVDPEADLWACMRNAGAKVGFVRRITAVKFPAVYRKNAYKERRCDEQAVWSHRIETEADFEATELAKMLTPYFPDERAGRRFGQVWREFRQDMQARLRRKLVKWRLVKPPTRPKLLERRRKFKGVE